MSGETPETKSQFAILKSRAFLPLFLTQAIGAFNDNGLRNGIAILITFDLAVKHGWDATLFVQAGLALFMLPYFLFSAIAGQLADKHDKATLSRWIKLFDLAAMVFGAFRKDWQKFDFSKTRVSMKQGSRTIIEKTGGHPTGNPAKPAVVLANLRRGTTGLKAGTFIVTGSFTGFHPVELNQPVTGEFDGFGTMEATIVG